MLLSEVFKEGIQMGPGRKGRLSYPGTASDFVKWLGAKSAKALEEMSFADMEQLPTCKKFNIVPLGGGRWHSGQVKFTWMVMQDSENLRMSETFAGTGLHYNHASLLGLLVLWEMVQRRRSQGRRYKRDKARQVKGG